MKTILAIFLFSGVFLTTMAQAIPAGKWFKIIAQAETGDSPGTIFWETPGGREQFKGNNNITSTLNGERRILELVPSDSSASQWSDNRLFRFEFVGENQYIVYLKVENGNYTLQHGLLSNSYSSFPEKQIYSNLFISEKYTNRSYSRFYEEFSIVYNENGGWQISFRNFDSPDEQYVVLLENNLGNRIAGVAKEYLQNITNWYLLDSETGELFYPGLPDNRASM